MKKLILNITLLINLALIFHQQTKAQCHMDDWAALKAFYESTNGDNWINNTGWEEVTASSPSTLCNLENLYGVRLNTDGRVGTLELNNNQLNGSIPTDLSKLSGLVYLKLSYNQLNGSIPIEVGNLYNLKVIYLDNNDELSGSIPSELGNLNDLRGLDLYGNKFTGQIPTTLGNLTKLTLLDLGTNQLSGNIPKELGNLNNLINLSLANNQLNGKIPKELGNLIKLTHLWLFLNKLYGDIPIELGNLTNLTQLWLYLNQLSGDIPTELGNLINLESLYLYSNQLEGNIPVEIGNLINMGALRLDSNEFTGTIPQEFGNLTKLGILTLSDNKLTGFIPPELNNLSELVILSIRNNYFYCTDINSIAENITFFYHSPQYYIPENYDSIKINILDSLSVNQNLILSVSLPFENSAEFTYQWKQNGKTIPGATQTTYLINNVSIESIGKYRLHVYSENCLSDEVELVSEPIYVRARGYDLYGQPVQYNQLVVAFDNAEETQQFKNEVLDRNAGFEQKACNCNRELYLWQFPSTEEATRALLEVDQKYQTIKTVNKPTGGFNNLINISETSDTSFAYNILSDNFSNNYPDSASIFILDSGLDETNYNADLFLYNEAAVDICYGIEAASGYSYSDTTVTITTGYTDDLWHGTFGFRSITENLNGNVNLKLVPLKIFDNSGNGNLFDMICALYHAIDHNADVVNISAGFKGQPSDELEKAIDLARQKGIFVVAAAGNDSLNIDLTPQYPAYYASQYYKFETTLPGVYDSIRYDNVISIASIDTANLLSSFSNYGKQSVTLACYGENIHSYGLEGNDVVAGGSSMATYFASKALALEIAKNRQRDYQQVWNDFETDWLITNSNLSNITRTGKQIDFEFQFAEIEGCSDPQNCNYFTFANIDDGSCLPAFINLVDSINQSAYRYHANDSIISNNIINSFDSKIYEAGSFIRLDSGFEVEVGSEFEAKIELCE